MVKDLLKNVISQSAEIIGCESGAFLGSGIITVCSDPQRTNTVHPCAKTVLEHPGKAFVHDDTAYYKVFVKDRLEYVLYIASPNADNLKSLAFMATGIANVKSLYDDKHDRLTFIKNLIVGVMYTDDIAGTAKDLRIAYAAPRMVFFIKTSGAGEVDPYEVLDGMFPNRAKDFIIRLDEDEMVFIKELRTKEHQSETCTDSKSIIDTLSTELMVNIRLGTGSPAMNLAGLHKSCIEARKALEIGTIFENESNIFEYGQLGLLRLIYNMPAEQCRVFLDEVFKGGSLEMLDNETLITARKLIENDLNVSETARRLFIHRNTLLYRLDKIQKVTGLDLKKFDDAVIFRVAMLVKNFLDKVVRKW